MSSEIIITEKPQQADAIAHMLAGRSMKSGGKSRPVYRIGERTIIPMQGHTMEQVMPEDIRPDMWSGPWAGNTFPILPEKIPLRAKKTTLFRLKILKEALKGFKGIVVIACDMDREGERIAHDALAYCGYKGPRFRMVGVNEVTPAAFRKIFDNRVPASDFEPKVVASQARDELDFLWGMGPSRAASVAFKTPGPLSQGRVQSVALALIVRRERQIAKFVPKPYFEVAMTLEGQHSNRFTLTYAPEGHENPAKDRRIYSREHAAEITRAAGEFKGPVSVSCEPKRAAPPELFEANSLQRAGATNWGWPADKTLEIADSVRLKGLITYIRGDKPYLTDDMIPSAAPLLNALTALPEYNGFSAAAKDPVIRKDKIYNSKKLEGSPHHGIIPSISYLEEEGRFKLESLTADERKVFDLVARRYIAAHMPSYEFDQTVISAGVPVGGAKIIFTSVGNVPRAEGWRAVLPSDGAKGEVVELPEVSDGEVCAAIGRELLSKKTKAPKHLSEASVLSELKRLSIGTSSSWHTVLKTLRARHYIEGTANKVRATAWGHGIVEANETVPAAARCLVNPKYTGVVEERLKAIDGAGSVAEARALRAKLLEEVREDVREVTMSLLAVDSLPDAVVARFKNTPRGVKAKKGSGGPTAKMLSYAKELAERADVKLPSAAKTDFDACSKFISKHKGV